MCDEVQGTYALTLAGRGPDTVLVAGAGDRWIDSPCVACGGCVDACPTGALFETGFRDPRPIETITRTTCGYCGVGCSLDVHVRDDAVAAVTPALDGPVNRGTPASRAGSPTHSPDPADRLTSPLIRRDGRLQPATWEEALGLVGRELRRTIAQHGPDSVAAISSARATNEENYLLQKLMRTVIGTNNVDNCSRLCHAPSAAGLVAAFGLSGGTTLLRRSRPDRLHPACRRQSHRGAPCRRCAPQAAGPPRRPAGRDRSTSHRAGRHR